MNEIARTPGVIAGEIRGYKQNARQILLVYAIEIGRRLCEAKELVPYGEWGSWLQSEVNYSSSTAGNLMQLFNEFGKSQKSLFGAEIDSQTFGKLTYSKALALCAVDAEEREEFVKTNDVEGMSVRELQQAIRERDEALKAKEEAEKEADELDEERARLDEELRELRNKPIDVAVLEPDPAAVKKAVDEALADAKANHEKEQKKLREKLEAVEKKRDKLEQDVKAAEAAKNAAEESVKNKDNEVSNTVSIEKARLERDIAELKKQLAMADPVTTQFKTLFEAAQETLAKLLALLGKAEEGRKESLRTAFLTMLETYAGKAGE
jgi:septal ring factor EnvC (AmiA/AmiB activator)